MEENNKPLAITQKNRQMVLEIVRQNPRISRKELSSVAGMSPSLITKICAELLDKKLIHEVGTGHSSGGRRPVYIEMDHNAFYLLGIYLSETDLNLTICDYRGNIKALYKNEISTRELLSGDILKTIHEYEKRSGYSCRGVGLAAEDGIYFDGRFEEAVRSLSKSTATLALRSSHAALIGLSRAFNNDYYQNSAYIHFGTSIYGAIMSDGLVLGGKDYQIGSGWDQIPFLAKFESELLSGKLSDEEITDTILMICDQVHILYRVDMMFIDLFEGIFSNGVRRRIGEKIRSVRDYDIVPVPFNTVFQRGVTIELASRINYGGAEIL